MNTVAFSVIEGTSLSQNLWHLPLHPNYVVIHLAVGFRTSFGLGIRGHPRTFPPGVVFLRVLFRPYEV